MRTDSYPCHLHFSTGIYFVLSRLSYKMSLCHSIPQQIQPSGNRYSKQINFLMLAFNSKFSHYVTRAFRAIFIKDTRQAHGKMQIIGNYFLHQKSEMAYRLFCYNPEKNALQLPPSRPEHDVQGFIVDQPQPDFMEVSKGQIFKISRVNR